MITTAQTQDEIDEQELEAQRKLNPLPQFEHEAASTPLGPVSELEICRVAAKFLRQLLLGYTLAEIEAMYPQNSIEKAEDGNLDFHSAAVKKLESMADQLDPPSVKLKPLATKIPSLPFLMPALRRQIRLRKVFGREGNLAAENLYPLFSAAGYVTDNLGCIKYGYKNLMFSWVQATVCVGKNGVKDD